MYANIQKVGMPKWSEADQAFAKLVQRNMKVREQGLPTEVGQLGGPDAARGQPGRRVGRHRRRVVVGAHGHASLPGEHPRA